MIPDSELERLDASVAEALLQGEAGRVRYGAQILKQGQSRAEQCFHSGEEWGMELARHYREHLQQFIRKYPL